MPFLKTAIEGLLVFEPQVWEDERGYFFESYNSNTFQAAGLQLDFVQDNQARSTYGVLRGLHYQAGAYAQAKLVRVLEGEVLDIVVDLRPDSKTYGELYSIILSASNQKQLLVPRGFAHGYAVLSPTATFFYKCDNFYNKTSEGGILYSDPTLNIDGHLPKEDIILSEKDQVLPTFGNHKPAL